MRKMEFFAMESVADSLTRQLGKNIRSRRKQLGLTQEQLAEMLGVGHQALSRIEQGKMAPKMDRLPTLAKSLHCSVSDLFRQTDENITCHADQIAELLVGLSTEKKDFIVSHISSIVHFIRL